MGVYHWGAFNNGMMVACVSFGSAGFALHRGIFAEASSSYDLRVYQLTRGGTAPIAPKCTGSWIVSRGLNAIRKLRGDCIIVAYSDPLFNEIGTIYQAANFIYIGKTNPKGQSDYIINGIEMSGWKVRKKFGTRDMKVLTKIDPDIIRNPLNPKYRYVYFATESVVQKKLKSDFRHLIQPNPKRDAEEVGRMNIGELVRRRTNHPSRK